MQYTLCCIIIANGLLCNSLSSNEMLHLLCILSHVKKKSLQIKFVFAIFFWHHRQIRISIIKNVAKIPKEIERKGGGGKC